MMNGKTSEIAMVVSMKPDLKMMSNINLTEILGKKMNIRDESKKAFPCDSRESYEFAGMDLRDYFAAKAMNAFLRGCSDAKADYHAGGIAIMSYEMADAMMKERKI